MVLVATGSGACVLLFLAFPFLRGGRAAATVQASPVVKAFPLSSAGRRGALPGEARLPGAESRRPSRVRPPRERWASLPSSRPSGEGARGAQEREPPVRVWTVAGYLVDGERGGRRGGIPFTVTLLAGPLAPARPSITVDRGLGCFRVAGLAPGPYLLEVRAEGFPPVPCRFRVPMESRLGVVLLRGARMRVRVTDEYAAPAETARFFRAGPYPGSGVDPWPGCRLGGRAGWFVLEGLEEGPVDFYVEAPGLGGGRLRGCFSGKRAPSYWVVLPSFSGVPGR